MKRVILITGASSDIAQSIIKYYKNDKFILTYYHHKDEVLSFVRKENIDASLFYLDLCNEESIRSLYNFVKMNYDKIDILINNAGINMDSYYLDKTKDEFMKVLETNLVGTFLMIKYFDNIVDGFIFNISSTDGIDTGSIYSIDYNASKAGINTLSKNISMASHNKIISICPNWIDNKTTRSMDKSYLESELKRIKQDRLINLNEIPKVIDKCIKDKIESGSIIRIDGDDNDK